MKIAKLEVIEFTCTFNLQKYPFDNQECFLVLVNKGSNHNNVQLISPLKVAYNGGQDFLNYIIEKPEIIDTTGPPCSVYRNCTTFQGNTIIENQKILSLFKIPDCTITLCSSFHRM